MRSGYVRGRSVRTPSVRATALALALLAPLASTAAHGTASDAASAPAALVVRLLPGASVGELVFELGNAGRETLRVLRRDTPLEATLSADVFDIRPLDGELSRARYTGRIVKRARPAAADFVTLAPGATLSGRVELARHYAIAAAGVHRVAYRGRLHVAPGTADAAAGAGVRAGGADETIALLPAREDTRLYLDPVVPTPRARPPTFNACDAAERDILVEATAAAETITAESLASLRELPEGERANAPRYLRWFGTYASARYERVADGYEAMLGALTNSTLNYDCGCDERGAFAFVYPLELHDIYLCPSFFAAPLFGTDSRAGTIVHELSHFTALLGTVDHVYGQDAAATLAVRDPERAADNADNYEYFAENTPALPMRGGDDAPVPFATLVPGLSIDGTVGEGEVDRYRVDRAERFELVSRRGDADLYVYDAPSLDEESLLCSSFEQAGSVDRCEVDAAGTYYVEVVGHTAADYTLRADVDGGSGPRDDSPGQVAGGGAVGGDFPAGDDGGSAGADGSGATGGGAGDGGGGGDDGGGGAVGWLVALLGAMLFSARCGTGRPRPVAEAAASRGHAGPSAVPAGYTAARERGGGDGVEEGRRDARRGARDDPARPGRRLRRAHSPGPGLRAG